MMRVTCTLCGKHLDHPKDVEEAISWRDSHECTPPDEPTAPSRKP